MPFFEDQNQKQRVGEVRPSQMLYTYGVGATVDLPNISVMIMGLNEWNKDLCQPINEGRLLTSVQEVLGRQVQELRQPPFATSDITANAFDAQNLEGVPVAPFPNWVVCPRCRLLSPLQKDVFEFKADRFRPDRNSYVHALCRGVTKGPKVLPTRFIAVCPKGHIDDFPWHYFVHGKNSDCDGRLRLKDLKKYGTPSDLLVYCEGCGKERQLTESIGIKGKESMPTCRGRHPHLRSFEESCDEQLKTVTLGASNTWFGINLSVLTIPTEDSVLGEMVEQNWKTFENIKDQETFNIVFESMLSVGQLQDFLKFERSEIWEKIDKKHSKKKDVSSEDEQPTDLKLPEWHILTKADSSKNSLNFSLSKTDPPKGFEDYFEKTVVVERLREVRALVGFTRLEAAETYEDLIGESDIERVPLYRGNSSWTLATEVRGEGIFLEFKESAIDDWTKRFQSHLSKLDSTGLNLHEKWREARFYENPSAHYKGVRFLLIHSFSHVLMRQLALECGYASASLSERIYCHSVEENEKMAGVLIYTSSSDSEGTLGGLSSLGEPAILGRHIMQALEEMEMCSSDPLCSEHEATQDETSLHWAACHACLFSPETSCESGNRNLDRAILVPTIRKTNYSFFK